MKKRTVDVPGLIVSCRLLAAAAAAATLASAAPPFALFKGYSVSSISVGGTTSLGFAVSPNGSLSNLTVTDVLPSNQVVASSPGLINGCGGSLTATAGSSTVTLTVPTLALGCTFQVNVTGIVAGAFINTVTGTSDQGTSAPATATLVVNPGTGPTITANAPSFALDTTIPILIPVTVSPAGTTGTFSLTSGPSQLSIDRTSGVISGMITHAGAYTFGVQFTATAGQTATTGGEIKIILPCDCDEPDETVTEPGSAEEVNTSTGGLQGGWLDLFEGGPLPLVLARVYNSTLPDAGVLGPGWRTSFEESLNVSGDYAEVTLMTGRRVLFAQSGSGWVQQGGRVLNQLNTTATGYQFLNLSTNLIDSFSNAGLLLGFIDRKGNTLTFARNSNNLVDKISDGLGRYFIMGYNGSNLLSVVTDEGERSVQYGYTNGHLTSAVDANGGTRQFNYSPTGGLMISEQKPNGNTPLTVTYNSLSQVQTVADGLANTGTFGYNPSSNQTIFTDPRGNPETDTNEASFVLTNQTDALNESQAYAYDSNFRLLQFTNSKGSTTVFTYLQPYGYPASVTDPSGNITSFSWVPQTQNGFTYLNLGSIHYPDGTSDSFSYDGSGNKLTETDRAGNLTTRTYNVFGQVLTVTNPAGGTLTHSYNPDGTLASSTDPAGHVTSYFYDTAKRPIQFTFADGAMVSLTLDAMDHALSYKDENENLTVYGYDANGNFTLLTDATSKNTTAMFDANDRTKSTIDALGNTTLYIFDSAGNLSARTNASGETTTVSYDVLNRPILVLDPAGFGTAFAYDAAGNLISLSDALSNTWSFVVDAAGRAIRATSPLGAIYARTFDSFGHVTSSTTPLGAVTNATYNGLGSIKTITAPLESSFSLSYDSLGFPFSLTNPNGHVWVRNNDNQGRFLGVTDPLGRTRTSTYDLRNRLKSSTTSVGSEQRTYDAAGNLAKIVYGDGTSRNFTYDVNNRLTGANGATFTYNATGDRISSNGIVNGWDAVHRLLSVTYRPGKKVTYGYTSRGFLGQLSDWTGASTSFAYDNAGRLLSITRSNGVTTHFSYDNDGRVISITETASGQTLSSIVYQRNANGDVISETRSGQPPAPALGVNTFSFDAAEQIIGDTYDGAGRLVQDALRTYTWNQASELTGYNGADGSASLGYDGLGNRISITIGGVTQNIILDYTYGPPTIAGIQSGGVDQYYYLHLPDGRLLCAINAATNAHIWFHFDAFGTTNVLTDDGARITDTYRDTPDGETESATGTTVNPFVYLGEWGVMKEGATGLYYGFGRFYDSISARLLSPTNIWLAGPMMGNPYQNTIANPIGYISSLGLGAPAVNTGSFLGDVFFNNNFAWANGLSGGVNLWANTLQAAADLNIARGEAIEADVANTLFDWYEGYLNGTLSFEPDGATLAEFGDELVQTEPQTWERAAMYVDSMFCGDPVSGGLGEEGFGGFLTEASAVARRRFWYREATEAIQAADAEATALAGTASKLKAVGTGLAVIGTVVQTGLAVHEDIKNGAGVIVTATDASATILSNGLVLAAPPVAVVDAVTGGTVSGLVHNALVTPNTIASLASRTTSREQTAIKKIYTRFAVGRWLWAAGEWLAGN